MHPLDPPTLGTPSEYDTSVLAPVTTKASIASVPCTSHPVGVRVGEP